ncbi:hypothetical protein HDV00_009585 [Rhizophlyctis rosea]|nr:hypothetical protein HDV00_009585 [Rhizophlyctis rosea]
MRIAPALILAVLTTSSQAAFIHRNKATPTVISDVKTATTVVPAGAVSGTATPGTLIIDTKTVTTVTPRPGPPGPQVRSENSPAPDPAAILGAERNIPPDVQARINEARAKAEADRSGKQVIDELNLGTNAAAPPAPSLDIPESAPPAPAPTAESFAKRAVSDAEGYVNKAQAAATSLGEAAAETVDAAKQAAEQAYEAAKAKAADGFDAAKQAAEDVLGPAFEGPEAVVDHLRRRAPAGEKFVPPAGGELHQPPPDSDGLRKRAVETGEQVIGGVTNAIPNLNVQDDLHKIKDSIPSADEVVNNIRDTAASAGHSAQEYAQQAKESVVSTASDAASSLGSITDTVADAANAAKASAADAAEHLKSAASDAATSAQQSAQQAGERALRSAHAAAGAIRNAGDAAAEQASRGAQAAKGTYWDVKNKADTKAKRAVQDAREAAEEGVARARAAAGTAKVVAEDAAGQAKAAGERVVDTAEEYVDYAWERAQGVAAEAGNVAEQATDAIKGAAGQATDAVKGAAGQAADVVQDAAGHATNVVKDAAGQATDAVKSAAEQAKLKARSVGETAEAATGAVKEALGDAGEVVADVASDAADTVKEGLASAGETAKEWAGAAAGKLPTPNYHDPTLKPPGYDLPIDLLPPDLRPKRNVLGNKRKRAVDTVIEGLKRTAGAGGKLNLEGFERIADPRVAPAAGGANDRRPTTPQAQAKPPTATEEIKLTPPEQRPKLRRRGNKWVAQGDENIDTGFLNRIVDNVADTVGGVAGGVGDEFSHAAEGVQAATGKVKRGFLNLTPLGLVKYTWSANLLKDANPNPLASYTVTSGNPTYDPSSKPPTINAYGSPYTTFFKQVTLPDSNTDNRQFNISGLFGIDPSSTAACGARVEWVTSRGVAGGAGVGGLMNLLDTPADVGGQGRSGSEQGVDLLYREVIGTVPKGSDGATVKVECFGGDNRE